MGHSPEKTLDAVTDLPNPELNPLLNPTLGRHLGRWAQVYFTSPPEKREEAVGELLRELQGQPESTAAENDTSAVSLPATKTFTSEPTVRCAECGHRHKGPQRFCGMCGAPLTFEQPDEERYGLADVTAGSSYPPDPVFALPSLAPASETRRSAGDDVSDIRWLREKNLTRGISSWPRMGPRYAPAALAVLAIGILIYAQWKPSLPQAAKHAPSIPPSAQKSSPPAAPQEKSPAPTPAPTSSSSPGNSAATMASGSAPSRPPVNNAAVNHNSIERVPEENHVVEAKPAANKAPQPTAASIRSPETASTPSTANGSLELAQAEEFLNGRKYPRDSAMAARFLWKAVGKENPSAILLLSDMYLIGDGVPRSCDQARLLLTAAARKGVPQAAVKLRNLLRSGCH